MTALLDRWQTGELVGNAQHVLVVRVRRGQFLRQYKTDTRIDNGQPIHIPRIFNGQNHEPWMATWVPSENWRTLPNVQNAKHTRSFDQKGSSSATVLIDNVAYPEETGSGGDVYHLMKRGYFSPGRHRRSIFGPDMIFDDTGWTDVLTGGCQIELWEGYGTGAEVVPLAVPDPVTHSCQPSDAIERTFTGIIETADSESHPDHITITARDFGIAFTDQRLQGDNKARECSAPITFGDLKKTLGEQQRAFVPAARNFNPLYGGMLGAATGDGGVLCGVDPSLLDTELGGQPQQSVMAWSTTFGSSSDYWWIEVPVSGFMDEFMCDPAFQGMEAWVCVYMGAGGDGPSIDGSDVAAGWASVGGGTAPDGTPAVRHWITMPGGGTPFDGGFGGLDGFFGLHGPPRQIFELGHMFFLPDTTGGVTPDPSTYGTQSRIRIYFSKLFHLTPAWLADPRFGDPPGTVLAAAGYYAGASVSTLAYGNDPQQSTSGANTAYDALFGLGVPDDPFESGMVNADKWVLVKDASDIVLTLVVWAGFKEWVVEPFGWTIQNPMQYGEDKFFTDVLDDVLAQGNYVFFMGPPTNDDRSIGVPHFEYQRAISQSIVPGLQVTQNDVLEAVQEKWDLSSLPYVIRYRGDPTDDGQTYEEDLVPTFMATYFPPWSGVTGVYEPNEYGGDPRFSTPRVGGVVRHFLQSVGAGVVIGLQSNAECAFACILAAVQYALQMHTGQVQVPGLPDFMLNRSVFVTDESVGVHSYLWIASIESQHALGPKGKWEMTVGGSFVQNTDMDLIRFDYMLIYDAFKGHRASSGEGITSPAEYTDRSLPLD